MLMKEQTAGFARECRLLDSGDFAKVFDDVHYRVVNRYFVLIARPNNLTKNRLGCVFSKKKAKRAVDRNRFRRLHRECFRTYFRRNTCGYDVVVLLRKGFRPEAAACRGLLFEGVFGLWTKLAKAINTGSSS